jgi:hypothetical protein
MPARYLAIRNKLKQEGLSTPAAKTRAAKIFNATRGPKTPPVTGKHKAK